MTASARTPVAPSPARCRGCGAPLRVAVVCDQCRAFQDADEFDLFTLLGLPRRFDVQEGDLRQRYLLLARLTHPDRAASAADQAQRLSARVNRAFEVLRDPVLRAEYLLELSGGPSAAQERSVPPEVLAKTLSIREELDDYAAAADASRRATLRDDVTRARDTELAEIEALARRLPGDEALRHGLRTRLNAIRYYLRLLEQVEA